MTVPAPCPISRLAGLAVILTAVACGGAPAATPAPPPPSTVGLRPGDAVRVDIWREPDLTGEFMVAPNGRVVFPLLGEKDLTGLSAEDIRAQLTAEYRVYLRNPSVEVTVLRRIAILGGVRSPGLYKVDPTVTLTEALAMAGGVSPTGNKDDIRLVRGDGVLVQSMDANQVLGATAIESGDQILVGQQSWARRNAMFITAGLGAATSIVVAFILAAGR
jgi:polysaccharide export outer membrane protein